MTTTTKTIARLSCNHSVVVSTGTEVGTKTVCHKCPRKGDTGNLPNRTVKAIVSEAPVPVEGVPFGQDLAPAPKVSPKTAARAARLERAKAAAANGGDAEAVLAEPLPTEAAAPRRRGRAPSRVTFLNLSPVRVAALLAAGFPQARLEASTVDLQADDVTFLLENLGRVCDSDGTEAKAACRLVAWLERFRTEL